MPSVIFWVENFFIFWWNISFYNEGILLLLLFLLKELSLHKLARGLESVIWTHHLTLGVFPFQIRQRQKAQKKARPLHSRRPQTRRSSSRRSGYAFAHQEGYGELITSGKNMRAKNPPLTSGLEKTLYNSTSWIENFCKKTTDTVSSFSQDKTVKLWVKMNSNHIVTFQLKLKFSWLQSLGSGVGVGQIASLNLNLWQTAASAHQIGVHYMGNQARWSLSKSWFAGQRPHNTSRSFHQPRYQLT